MMFLLIIIAGIAKACADTCMADRTWELSVFNTNGTFMQKKVAWLPNVTWRLWFAKVSTSAKNKNAHTNKILNKLFRNVLVMFTDLWHFSQFVMVQSLIIAALCYHTITPYAAIDFILLCFVFHTSFVLFYNKLLIK